MSPSCGAPTGTGGALEPGLCVGTCGAAIAIPRPPPDDDDDEPPSLGLDLSSVSTFFSDLPFLISPSSASLPAMAAAGGAGAGAPLPSDGAGGGGGGGGGAGAMFDCVQLTVYLTN